MTAIEAFELLPLSEKTLIRYGFKIGRLHLMNNLGHPCLYTIFDSEENKEIGIVEYYRGRKSCLVEKHETPIIKKN
ncbi:MAG: hypothetical protein DDT19_00769 [Syntrophomonadaceae bacterium]|nr:hypothetical protein [Bacillota bacterium]